MQLGKLQSDLILHFIVEAHVFPMFIKNNNLCLSSRLYGLDGLTKVCHNFMDRHAYEVLQHESFVNISIVSFIFF